MKQWITDVKLIRFTWLVPGCGECILEIVEPIEVIKDKDCDRFMTLKGHQITVDHSWNYCHTIKRGISS